MYFDANQQFQQAFEYLKQCQKKKQEDEYYSSMPKYFDGPTPYGICLRAELKDDNIMHLLVTPHWECFRYELLLPDYTAILGTSAVMDKVNEIFGEEPYLLKVDNKNKHDKKQKLYSGELYQGFYECKEESCFYYKQNLNT